MEYDMIVTLYAFYNDKIALTPIRVRSLPTGEATGGD